MGKAEIYYFSGTGNSLAVARDVARQLNAEVIPVAPLVERESIDSGADIIGFVFPIYDFKPPRVVDSFISRLANIDTKYLFGICTYGIAPSQSLKHFDKTIRSVGGRLSGGFAVGMPFNGIGCGMVTKDQHARLFANWRAKSVEVCEYVSGGRQGRIDSSSLLYGLRQPGLIRMAPSIMRFLVHALFKGVHSFALVTDEHCTGCGTCERICPMNNVKIVGHKPAWSNRCVSCLACYHWCPNNAISLGGVDLNIASYHHPDVIISDMLRPAMPGTERP